VKKTTPVALRAVEMRLGKPALDVKSVHFKVAFSYLPSVPLFVTLSGLENSEMPASRNSAIGRSALSLVD
jgi:hypothetical protein